MEGEEGAFAAGTAAWGKIAIVGIGSYAVQVGICFEVHHGLGNCGSAVEDGTGSSEDGDEMGVFFCNVVPVGYVAGGASKAFESYVLLDANGEAV